MFDVVHWVILWVKTPRSCTTESQQSSGASGMGAAWREGRSSQMWSEGELQYRFPAFTARFACFLCGANKVTVRNVMNTRRPCQPAFFVSRLPLQQQAVPRILPPKLPLLRHQLLSVSRYLLVVSLCVVWVSARRVHVRCCSCSHHHWPCVV